MPFQIRNPKSLEPNLMVSGVPPEADQVSGKKNKKSLNLTSEF